MGRLSGSAVILVLLLAIAEDGGGGALAQDNRAQAREKGEGPKPVKLTLTPVKHKKGALRMGYGLKQEPPTEGVQAKGKGPTDTYLFFDLNGDGKIEAGLDGFGIAAYPFVVLLPEKVLLKYGQCAVSFDGAKSVTFTPEDLGAAQQCAIESAVFTDIRMRAGLQPVPVDVELSVACEKHIEYLKLNGLADGKSGVDCHKEEPGKPGYSEDGASAGRQSNLSYGGETMPEAVANWLATPWHGAPMVNPKLTAIGVARKHGVCALHVKRTEGDQEAISLHPADGAVGMPRAFAKGGEIPNPVPGTRDADGCGFPILIRLVPPYRELVAAEVLDAKGGKVKGTFSSPAKPANAEWTSNSNCALFIPAQPLAPNMNYRVTFQFAEEKELVRWTFTTGP